MHAVTIPCYTKLRWVPFKMRFIKIDLINDYLTKKIAVFNELIKIFFRNYEITGFNDTKAKLN